MIYKNNNSNGEKKKIANVGGFLYEHIIIVQKQKVEHSLWCKWREKYEKIQQLWSFWNFILKIIITIKPCSSSSSSNCWEKEIWFVFGKFLYKIFTFLSHRSASFWKPVFSVFVTMHLYIKYSFCLSDFRSKSSYGMYNKFCVTLISIRFHCLNFFLQFRCRNRS